MTEIPVGYGECTFVYGLTADPEPMVTAIGFRDVDGGTYLELASAFSIVAAAWLANQHSSGPASLYAGWSYIRAEGRFNSSDLGMGGIDIPYNIAGTGVGGTLANNSTVLVQKRSALAGRKNRGRMFIPPFNLLDSEVGNGGVINAPQVTAFQSQMDDFFTDGSAGSTELCILHASALETPTPITQLLVANQIATQRRRMRS